MRTLPILPIIHLTFKEAVRNRVMYLFIFFGSTFIFGSRIVGMLTVGDELKVAVDLALFTLTLMDILIAIFVGIDLLHKELDKRTIYVILSKPVRRAEFILGKFLGLLLTLGLLHIAMTLLFCGYLALFHGFSIRFITASLASFMEIIIVTAVVLLYSSFSTPILSGIFTLATWVIGRGLTSLKWYMDKLPPGIERSLIYFLYILLPNFSRFNLETHAVYGVNLPHGYLLSLAGELILYVSLFLTATILIFRNRDFL